MSRKSLLATWCLLPCLLLSGCHGNMLPSANELDQFEIVQVVGIDPGEQDSSQVEVSLIMQNGSESSEKGASPAAAVTILSAEGPTVFDAIRKIKASCDKIIFFGQVDYFLIGEEAAAEDFIKYYDLIQRGPEIRLSSKVYIIRDCTAKEFLATTSSNDKFISDRLEALRIDAELFSNTDEATVIDVTGMLDNRQAATVIPALCCAEPVGKQSTGKLPEKDIRICGYAVIKDFRLAGYLDEEYARGYNFLTNRVYSCPINVKDSTGAYVALEVVGSKTQVITSFEGGVLKEVTYRTHVVSNIEEQQSRENIYTDEQLEALAARQSEILQASMEQVVQASMDLQADCTALGQAVSLRHPFRWDRIRDHWAELYPTLQIHVSVESEIARSYDIVEPNGYETEG